MREVAPQCFYMAELWGEERPQSALSSGYHPPSLVRHDSFSQLLFTSAETRTARNSRLWVGLTADHAHAAGGRPLINIKMQMRHLRLSQTFMAPAEFTRCAFQALAHGAGLKLVTLAIPERVLDARTLPRAREVFAFMRAQAAVFDTMTPLASTALVWPEGALLEGSALEGKTARRSARRRSASTRRSSARMCRCVSSTTSRFRRSSCAVSTQWWWRPRPG
jgi:hypothetical protein